MNDAEAIRLKRWELITGIHTIGASIMIGFIGKSGVQNLSLLNIAFLFGGVTLFFLNIIFLMQYVYNEKENKIDSRMLNLSFWIAITTLVLFVIALILSSGIQATSPSTS